jgi:urate oxidase
MPLIHSSYGKGHVRIMRVKRDSARHEVRELTVQVMLTGAFDASYTSSDNSSVIATDTVKNIVNVVARDHVGAETEPFAAAIAAYFLDHYKQVERVDIAASETKWARLVVDGAAHDHSFLLDSNGRPFARLSATRDATTIVSGIEGFSFMKSTASGWVGYVMDEVTTIKETTDRMFATAMTASWRWASTPASYPEANAAVMTAAMKVFASTYSPSAQHTMLLMGEAVLATVPEVAEISMACPNKHYLPIDLTPFGRSSDEQVFTPTDEPHGQIECTVGRR